MPGLHIDSWYDVIEAYPTVKMFQYLSGNPPNQHLVMGPTAHCRMGTETEATSVGDRSVGDGRFGYVEMILHWYDRWLKDAPSPELPAVQYYVLNSNQWQTTQAWPPPGGHPVRLYLSSEGRANSASGDGKLRPIKASGPSADEFVDDPTNPVPLLGGSCCSGQVARDQSPVEARQDVLVGTSRPFAEATRIVGDVDVTLSVSSSAPDTDLMVKLVDVDAAGRPYNLGDTAVRMRYRDGFAHPALMQPGKPYSVKITGLVTASDFLPGHRLRIEVAGTNSPNYERNLHSGGHNYDESAARPARYRRSAPRAASVLCRIHHHAPLREVIHVPEHQDAFQLRAAGDRRGDSLRVAPVRAQDHGICEAVEVQRGRLPPCRRTDRGGVRRLLHSLETHAPARTREVEAAKAKARALQRFSGAG